MNISRRISSILIAIFLFASCDNSTTTSPPANPGVTAPENTVVQSGDTVNLSFEVSLEAGYETATASAYKGEATITSEPEKGARNGQIIVKYSSVSAGAVSVELSVTDTEGQRGDATAVVEVKEEQTTIQVNDNISSDRRWEDGKTYILGGRIAVEAGATLTIEGGAVIKGEAGSGSNSSALIIARDATLNANGRADAPIIFTSVADEITPQMIDEGNFQSPNLTSDNRGLWGGLIVLGNAPISASSGTEAQIEGIPSSDVNGRYGGNDAEDSSGSISYVTIRHGGTNIGEGNEINGLSLGGVGSGTVVENVEVVANQDDGVEFFGGTVHVSNVLVWNNGDDAIDTDQAWAGTLDNVITVSPGGSTFELDGPEGSYTGSGHTIKNVSSYVETNGSELVDVDANTDVNLSNVLFFGLVTDDSGNAANSFSSDYPDYADNENGYAITSVESVLPSGTTIADYFPQSLVESGEVTEVSGISDATVGADVSVFGFTWASQSGTLRDIGLE